MQIVVDTREQLALSFVKYGDPPIIFNKLETGDYSVKGFESIAAIERKSESDLIGSLTAGRSRFERELARARGYQLFCVVAETTWLRLARHEYRSKADPHAILQSIIGLQVRYGVPFLLVETREAAAYTVFHLLRHFVKQREQELKAVLGNCKTEPAHAGSFNPPQVAEIL